MIVTNMGLGSILIIEIKKRILKARQIRLRPAAMMKIYAPS